MQNHLDQTAPTQATPTETASTEAAPNKTVSSRTGPSKAASGKLAEGAPMPESAKVFDTVSDSFKMAHRQEMQHKHKVREVWYKSIGEAHHLTGLLRSDNALKGYLGKSLQIRQHEATSDQLYLLKLIYKRAGLNIPDQTRHDHSMALIGLEAAKVPPDAQAAEQWLKTEEDFGKGPVSGKEKAMIYAQRAQQHRPRNKAAVARIANAERKRRERFVSYVEPKLNSPLADLSIQGGSSKLADGYHVVVMLKEGDRIRLLDTVADDEKTIQTTALRPR